MRFLRFPLLIVTGALVASATMTPAAFADASAARPPDAAARGQVERVTTITVERFDTAHRLLTVDTLAGPAGVGLDESGSGGTSSPSGCIKVTVHNYEKSAVFHTTLFGYHTWTSWCWNRAGHSVSSVATGYYISDLDWSISWEGEASRDLRYYAWTGGYAHSGYWHYRMGHFQQCYPWTCVNIYPSNTLRSHSDGTWTWATT
jgi:hypothetical protein